LLWLAVALLLACPARAQVAADDGGFPDQPVRALVTPRIESTLSSQLAARIERIEVEDGQRFRRGDVLVTFDCDVERAYLKKAEAELWGAEHSLEAKRKLEKRRAVSALDVRLAEAAIRRAEAELAIMQKQVQRCRITAPYQGRVVEVIARAYENVTPGDPLLKILDDSHLGAEILAPAGWSRWLKPGVAVSITIEQTGQTYRARVKRLGASVDAAGQMLPIYAEIDGVDADLLPGMSGAATFVRPP